MLDALSIPRPLRILIGCETSGVMRRAFAALGHDVWSNDIEPAEDGSNRHLRGDVRDYLDWGWDLLCVMHPPCTRLCNSGVRWLHEPPTNPPGDASEAERAAWPHMNREQRLALMWHLLERGADLFSACWNAPIPRIAVENPIMNPHAKQLITNYCKPAQTVQPWWFGDEAFKGTSFYLRGLPPLVPTTKLTPPKKGTEEHKRWSLIHRMPPGPERARLRSRTFPGLANAAAAQWSEAALADEQRAA